MPTPDAVLGSLLSQVVLDVDLLDLVMWSRLLTFDEFTRTLAAICACKWLAYSIDTAISHRVRALVVKLLLWLATLIKPA